MSDAEESPWLTGGIGGIRPHVAARLERIARDVAAEWGLTLGPRIVSGRYSYVAAAGDDAILKVTPVEDDEADNEADALALLAGDGAVRLLRHDRERRALLLERARPGRDASTVPDEEALEAAVTVARTLWRPATRGRPFRWIGEKVPRWLENAGDHELVRLAKQVYASLNVADGTLVHGDLHHHNLLRHGERWVLIDPKPMVGEPEFDVPAFLWNPIGVRASKERTERWIRRFAKTGLSEERIREWTIVRGAYQGLPLWPGETEETSPQLGALRHVL